MSSTWCMPTFTIRRQLNVHREKNYLRVSRMHSSRPSTYWLISFIRHAFAVCLALPVLETQCHVLLAGIFMPTPFNQITITPLQSLRMHFKACQVAKCRLEDEDGGGDKKTQWWHIKPNDGPHLRLSYYLLSCGNERLNVATPFFLKALSLPLKATAHFFFTVSPHPNRCSLWRKLY